MVSVCGMFPKISMEPPTDAGRGLHGNLGKVIVQRWVGARSAKSSKTRHSCGCF